MKKFLLALVHIATIIVGAYLLIIILGLMCFGGCAGSSEMFYILYSLAIIFIVGSLMNLVVKRKTSEAARAKKLFFISLGVSVLIVLLHAWLSSTDNSGELKAKAMAYWPIVLFLLLTFLVLVKFFKKKK